MHSLFSSYNERQKRRGAGEAAQRNAVYYLTKLEAWLDTHGIDPVAVTADELDDFVDSLRKQYKPSTVKLAIVQVRAAYRYAHRRGIIQADPAIDLVAPREPDVEPETYTPAQLRTILKNAPTHRHDALLKLMIFGGLRRVEVCRLKWDDVDFASQTLTVMGKGMKIRKVPIHPVVAESLNRLFPVPWGGTNVPNMLRASDWVCGTKRYGGLSTDSFGRMIDAISEASGISVKSHTFRKTLSTDLYERGVREDVLNDLFGWSKTSVRSRFYNRTAPESLMKAILLAYQNQSVA